MWAICVIAFLKKVYKHIFLCPPRWYIGGHIYTPVYYLLPSVMITLIRVSIYKLISSILRSLIVLLIETLIILMAVNNGM